MSLVGACRKPPTLLVHPISNALARAYKTEFVLQNGMTARQLDIDNSNPLLCALIAHQIHHRPQQRLTFADYMDLALYHPEYGYYATNQANIGVEGDFVTSAHLGADFGELLAEQFVQMWHLLKQPSPFHLIEMGAGQGVLAYDILRYLHRHHFPCFEAVDYIIVEKSTAMMGEQQQRLQSLANSLGHLRWSSWDNIAPDSIVGCCFSNELVDAFSVHQICVKSSQLQEVYVTLENELVTEKATDSSTMQPSFVEVIGELSTPQLSQYFDLIGIQIPSPSYPDGYRTEVNLAALDWINTIADRLHQGYVLTIDYGYPATRYYSPARSHGTLQCYYQQSHHSDPYRHVGRQDITAHVDFTALERQGELRGLKTVGFTQQGLFLMALGLGDRLAALSDPMVNENQSINDILRRRDALHALMNPMGLGSFGVLIQSKGLDEQQQLNCLNGLTMP
jgi:SAM-dependent MidA family methyltransferase